MKKYFRLKIGRLVVWVFTFWWTFGNRDLPAVNFGPLTFLWLPKHDLKDTSHAG